MGQGNVGTVKNAIMGAWEMPSDALMKQVADVKVKVPAAIAEANALMLKARAVSKAVSGYGVTILVP